MMPSTVSSFQNAMFSHASFDLWFPGTNIAAIGSFHTSRWAALVILAIFHLSRLFIRMKITHAIYPHKVEVTNDSLESDIAATQTVALVETQTGVNVNLE